MKLIYIKSAMEPKNYATLRSLLKQEQGEKIAPYVFKCENPQVLQEYLKKERIKYESYQEIPESEEEFAWEEQELAQAYREISQDQERKKITKSAQKAVLKDLRKRL
jgi:hypothetical protein